MSDTLYYDHLEFNGKRKEIRDNLAQNRINDIVDYKTYNLTMQGSEWITLAKVGNVLKNSSALFTITCYGVKDNERSILTTSKFSLSCGLSDTKELITSVTPLSQVPEIQQGGDASGGSSSEGGSTQEVSEASAEPTSDGEPSSDAGGSGESGSGNSAIYGLNNIAFEKYDDNTIYVMGLLSFPATDKYDSLDVEMRLDDNLNFEYLNNLEVIYKQGENQLLEGIVFDGNSFDVKIKNINFDELRTFAGQNAVSQLGLLLEDLDTKEQKSFNILKSRGHGTNPDNYYFGKDEKSVLRGITYGGWIAKGGWFESQDNLEGSEYSIFTIPINKSFTLNEIIGDKINYEDDYLKTIFTKVYDPAYVSFVDSSLNDDTKIVVFKNGMLSTNTGILDLKECKSTDFFRVHLLDENGNNREDIENAEIKYQLRPSEIFYFDIILKNMQGFSNSRILEIQSSNFFYNLSLEGVIKQSYSQSYELYNPYNRLDMLADGVVTSIDDATLDEEKPHEGFSLTTDNYYVVSLTSKKATSDGNTHANYLTMMIPKSTYVLDLDNYEMYLDMTGNGYQTLLNIIHRNNFSDDGNVGDYEPAEHFAKTKDAITYIVIHQRYSSSEKRISKLTAEIVDKNILYDGQKYYASYKMQMVFYDYSHKNKIERYVSATENPYASANIWSFKILREWTFDYRNTLMLNDKQVATQSFVEEKIGEINTILDAINGEEV